MILYLLGWHDPETAKHLEARGHTLLSPIAVAERDGYLGQPERQRRTEVAMLSQADAVVTLTWQVLTPWEQSLMTVAQVGLGLRCGTATEWLT